MQIKRFHAQNMTDALRQVKKEFGSEAVILSARSLKKEGGIFGQVRSDGVEITAAIDNRGRQDGRAGAFGYRYKAYTQSAPRPEERDRGMLRSLRGGVKVLRNRRRPDPGEPSSGGRRNEAVLDEVHRHLLAQKLEPELAKEICSILGGIQPAAGFSAREDMLVPLARCLKEVGMQTAAPGSGNRRAQTVVLMGATGVGKTTSAGKIAAAAALSGRHVALISLDTHQAGANARLSAYAAILGIPIAVASNDAELRHALKRFKDRPLTLVDTPGVGFEDDPRTRELLHRLESLRGAQRYLVVGATAKADDLSYQLGCARRLGITRLVLTKLDETRSVGDLILPLTRAGIPIAYLMNAPHVPDGIAPASVQRMAELLLHPERGRKPVPAPPPDPAFEAVPARQPAGGGGFVANRNSDTFHRPACRWVRQMKATNVVRLNSEQEAFARSYKPCRSCCPELQQIEPPAETGAARRFRTVAQ